LRSDSTVLVRWGCPVDRRCGRRSMRVLWVRPAGARLDLTILAALNGLAGKSAPLNGLLVFLAQYAVYLLALPLLALTFGVGLNHSDRMTVVVSLLGLALSLLVARQIGHAMSGTRPFVTEPWVVQLLAL
jgi:undecaprenyl-diphosphatase